MSYSFVGFACVDNLSMAYRHEIMEIILYSAFTFVVSRAFDPSHTREGRFRSFGNQSEQCLPRLGEVHLHDGPRPGLISTSVMEKIISLSERVIWAQLV